MDFLLFNQSFCSFSSYVRALCRYLCCSPNFMNFFFSSNFSHVSWTHIFKCLLAWIWSFDHGLYLKRNLFNGIIFDLLIFWGYWVFWALGLNNYRHNYSFHQYFNPDFVEDDHCRFWYLMPICLIVLIPCYGCGTLPINRLHFLFIDDIF